LKNKENKTTRKIIKIRKIKIKIRMIKPFSFQCHTISSELRAIRKYNSKV